jgi:DNA mismatch repair protein MutL
MENSATPETAHAVRRPIQVLPPPVAERIAAGEVIERPASVVKELVENSLDAGAGLVQVVLGDGGKALIEVTDDGHGMDGDNLKLSVLRHATSKISRLEDLDRLHTLGFRGEALPSVAAVSELSILSRARESASAHELRLGGWAETGATGRESSAEAVTFGHFLNSPHGTRIRAEGLFAQVPARLKFLKSQGAEVAAVREWLERLALAHPGVGFRLLSDGRKILDLKASSESDRVKAVLAGGEDYPVISVQSREGPLRLRLHWVQGLSLAHSRRLAQVVNSRAVRDRLLQQAMLSAFRQALLPGRFPALALYLEIDPSLIDVNVHPTKSEVRFLESRRIFPAIEALAESAIRRHGAPAYIPESSSPTDDVPLQWNPSGETTPLGAREATPFSFSGPPLASTPLSSGTAEQASFATAGPAPAVSAGLEPQRYVGSLFNTYLAYDLGSELVLVDQHAAHERIRYERLKKRVLGGGAAGTPVSQELLIPEAVRFAEDARNELEARLPWLEKLGFGVEIFGEGSALFRAIPADWGTDDLKIRLKNLLERALELPSSGKALLLDEALFERLASEACHSSVRGGDRLEREQALSLVERLFATEHPWNCPHGRPTVVRIPRGKLEEWFQRRAPSSGRD